VLPLGLSPSHCDCGSVGGTLIDLEKWAIMGKYFYLPPNAKTVKCTENSNAKSTNLILKSTKSQWKTLPLLVGWLVSPPWLNVK